MADADLVSHVYDAALDPKRWVDFAEVLEQSLGGAVVLLSLPQPGQDRRGNVVAPSLDARFVESYRQRYFALDPFGGQTESLAVGTLVSERSALWREELAGSSFLREWMEPQGLVPQSFLGCVVDRDGRDGTSLLSVFRREGTGRNVGVHATRLCPVLLPHLQRAVRIHFRSLRLEGERQALACALDRIPIAAILIDGRGQVRATNRRDGIVLSRDGLHASHLEDTVRLRRALAEAFRGDGAVGAGEPLLLERASGGRPLRALVSPLRVRSEGEAAEPSAAVVFVSDPDECTEPPCELLRSFYGLTHAESALARELA
ncbi:MAG: hypothetical protein ACRD1Z_04610, partial [Vicinamibacteria bacterium]